MYLPKGFNKSLSIELGELILQAYNQFAAFEDEKSWKLPEKYELIKEINYTWKSDKALEKHTFTYDLSISKKIILKRSKKLTIPIGFIVKCDDKLFLIYRGTKTAKEWVHNLSINLKEHANPKYGNAHEGFLQTYSLTRDTVMETLTKTGKIKKFFIAGHSLGAALATLASIDIETNTNLKIKSLYTYGSPRIGDNAFVNAFNNSFEQRAYRIVNTSDIVTSIPFPIPLAGLVGGYFSHVDTPVDFTIQYNDIELNHQMETYIEALQDIKESKSFLKKLFG